MQLEFIYFRKPQLLATASKSQQQTAKMMPMARGQQRRITYPIPTSNWPQSRPVSWSPVYRLDFWLADTTDGDRPSGAGLCIHVCSMFPAAEADPPLLSRIKWIDFHDIAILED